MKNKVLIEIMFIYSKNIYVQGEKLSTCLKNLMICINLKYKREFRLAVADLFYLPNF